MQTFDKGRPVTIEAVLDAATPDEAGVPGFAYLSSSLSIALS
jgi:hypothetical protein